MQKVTTLSIDEEYLPQLAGVSNKIWKLFVRSIREGKTENDLAFSDLLQPVMGTPLECYSRRYVVICRGELLRRTDEYRQSLERTNKTYFKRWYPPGIVSDPEGFIKVAREGQSEIWAVFKPTMQKILDKTMEETVWGDVSGRLAEMFHTKYEYGLAESYLRNYSLLCMDELDRSYRHVNHIVNDLSEYMVLPPKGRKRKINNPKEVFY